MNDWTEIPGFNGRYYINKYGAVKSCQPAKRDYILKERTDRAGYKTVRLSTNGITSTHFVHRLVAETFIDKETGKTYVNHKNGCKIDNTVENLEWVTHAENMRHAYDTGLCLAKGKVVVDDLHETCYTSVREAAEAYGINTGTCRNYLNGNVSNKTPLRYGEPVVVHVPVPVFGEHNLLYTRKVVRYI